MCVTVCLHMCMCGQVPVETRGRESEPLDLKVQATVSFTTGVENPTPVVCKNSKCS